MELYEDTKYIYADIINGNAITATLTSIKEGRYGTDLYFCKEEERDILNTTPLGVKLALFGLSFIPCPKDIGYIRVGISTILLQLDKKKSIRGLRNFMKQMMKDLKPSSELIPMMLENYRSLVNKIKTIDHESDAE